MSASEVGDRNPTQNPIFNEVCSFRAILVLGIYISAVVVFRRHMNKVVHPAVSDGQAMEKKVQKTVSIVLCVYGFSLFLPLLVFAGSKIAAVDQEWISAASLLIPLGSAVHAVANFFIYLWKNIDMRNALLTALGNKWSWCGHHA